MTVPYMKVMIRNRFFYSKTRNPLRINIDEILPNQLSEKETHEITDAQYKLLDAFLDQHKYGYIIFEMTKRGIHKIKDLSSFVPENTATLYKRYQKLVYDFKNYVAKINSLERKGN